MCTNCGEKLTAENKCECIGCFCEQEQCEHPKTGHHKDCHPQKTEGVQ